MFPAKSLYSVSSQTLLTTFTAGGEHPHHEEAPEYPYLRIRSKEFPWGDCALFDGACWKQKALEAANNEE